MKIDFFAKPSAVALYLQAKYPEIHFDYDEIMHEAHHRTFTIAKITRLDLLSDIQASLAKAAKNGQGFKEWASELKPLLAKKGWLGETIVTDPRTKKPRQIYVGSRRLKNIYNTNMRTAYATARYETQMNSDAIYFRYVAVMDKSTRASHAALHNLVLPKTHKFWDTHYPPNAWNCRCQVRALTKSEFENGGFSLTQNIPNIPSHPDWAYNVGKTNNLDNVLASKIENLSKKGVSKAFRDMVEQDFKSLDKDRQRYVWQRGLDEMIDEVIVKQNVKTPLNIVQVGFLGKTLTSLASKILGFEVESGGVILTKKELTHANPKRKEAYDHAFRVEEMRKVSEILADENNAYVDLRDKKQNIVFVFDDEKDSQRANLVPIEISKTHKKFKVKNYVITLDKIKKDDIKGMIKSGEFVKVKGVGGI